MLTRLRCRLAESYAHLIGVNDTFPDWDMLPLGTMMHAEKSKGVYGPASATRLTRDEQARAPPCCAGAAASCAHATRR